jgi:hypothetical protein
LFETVVIDAGSVTTTASPQQVLTVASFPTYSGCYAILQYFGSPAGWQQTPTAVGQAPGPSVTFPSTSGGGSTLSHGNTYYEFFAEASSNSPC